MKTILLVGNPNVGKTTILNKIAKTSFRVGNWAGVTVNSQEGFFSNDATKFKLLDLPGLYSLNPSTEDESLSTQHLFYTDYDLIVNVVDVHNLHQNLMLTLELLELNVPILIVLNFYDEFSKNFNLDIEYLEKECGVPVLPISLHKQKSLDTLIKSLTQTTEYSSWTTKKKTTNAPVYAKIEKLILEHCPALLPSVNQKLNCTQIILGNKTILAHNQISEHKLDKMKQTIPNPPYIDSILEKKMDLLQNRIIQKTNKRYKNWDKILDSTLLHPVAGYFLSSIILITFFNTVFNTSKPYIDFIDWIISYKIKMYISMLILDINPTIKSFIIDGLISGIGSVLTFVPLIFSLYIFLSILEESGYLARIAVLLDYPLSKVGLSGKSLFPMILGFGCTVPAIYGTRVIEDQKQRYLTASLSSLVSCGARLPVYALFIAAFFNSSKGFILFSLYFTGILLSIILAFFFSRYPLFQTQESSFLLVLPKYRIPNLSVIIKTAKFHTGAYIKNAGSIILGMLIIMWTISYFPNNGNISTSYLSKIGKAVQPIFIPLGFGDRWETVVAIIPSLIAKEASVGFLGQVLSFDEDKEENIEKIGSVQTEILSIVNKAVKTVIRSFLNIVYLEEEKKNENIDGLVYKIKNIWQDNNQSKKAYSFMLFILLTLPCVAAVGALRQELPLGYFMFTIGFYTMLPFIGSLVYYQIARLF